MGLCVVIKVHSLSICQSLLLVFFPSVLLDPKLHSFSINFQSSLPGQLPTSILQQNIWKHFYTLLLNTV